MEDTNELLDPAAGSNQNYGLGKTLPNATATLVLGICSIVGCIIYGVPGLICGIIALVLHQKDKKVFATDPSGYAASYKNARAGFVCAVIGTSLSALYFVIAIVAVVFALSLSGSRF